YFYEQFYREIDALGFSTRSRRYQIAAEKIDKSGLSKLQRIIFAGFFALTKAEKALFKKLLTYNNTVFVFQDGIGLNEKLKELGISCKIKEHEDTEPEVHFYSSPDTHGQVLVLG